MAARIAQPKHLVLYDGTCDLCSSSVSVFSQRDPSGIFRVATLQSDLAKSALARYGIDPVTSGTAIVLADWQSDTERILQRSVAIHFVAQQLGIARLPMAVLSCMPRSVMDWIYDLVARNRRRLSRKRGDCAIGDGD